MTLVTVNDLRQSGFCVSGAIRLAKAYDLDFRDFVKNGIDADVLLARTSDDALALRLVAAAVEREESNGRRG